MFRTLLTILVLSALFSTRFIGLYSHQALAFVLFLALLWGVVSRLWWWKKGTLHGRLNRDDQTHFLQAVGRGYFWVVLGFTTLIIFPRSAEMVPLMATIAVVWALVLGLQLLQAKQTNRGTTIVMLLGGMILMFDTFQALRPTVEPIVRIAAPFKGEWIVLQGGRSPLQSHHLVAYNQKYALDLVKIENGKIFRETEGNANVLCWEEPLYAPVDGTVVTSKGDMEDSEGLNFVTDPDDATGNTVTIQTEEGHYVVFAHLRQGSVVVSEGQSVKVGDPIGKTGNSGNTTMPHLHFQVQTHKDIWDPDNKSIPFAFGDGLVNRRNSQISG